MKLVTLLLAGVQNLMMLLMAPLTLAVVAGLVICTYLISRQVRRPDPEPKEMTAGEAYEWLGGPTSEWLGA